MINYKHLHYFLAVAREGRAARTGERLHPTPQTISAQLSLLEDYLGRALFTQVGRNLELTETGRQVSSYADEVFSLGGEFDDSALTEGLRARRCGDLYRARCDRGRGGAPVSGDNDWPDRRGKRAFLRHLRRAPGHASSRLYIVGDSPRVAVCR